MARMILASTGNETTYLAGMVLSRDTDGNLVQWTGASVGVEGILAGDVTVPVVKPFGFHAMRHKAAAITFIVGSLSAAQTLMGHYRAFTTGIYVRSAGLYGDQSVITSALGESGIGHAASQLLEKVMPHEIEAHEALSNQKPVTIRLQ